MSLVCNTRSLLSISLWSLPECLSSLGICWSEFYQSRSTSIPSCSTHTLSPFPDFISGFLKYERYLLFTLPSIFPWRCSNDLTREAELSSSWRWVLFFLSLQRRYCSRLNFLSNSCLSILSFSLFAGSAKSGRVSSLSWSNEGRLGNIWDSSARGECSSHSLGLRRETWTAAWVWTILPGAISYEARLV